jgi:hypothetical protein
MASLDSYVAFQMCMTAGQTIIGYSYPTTTELRTPIVKYTPLATLRLLPLHMGGGLLFPNGTQVQSGDSPIIVDRAL